MMSQPGDIPEHIAIIMDGNGRWARRRGLRRNRGHREGAESARAVVEEAARLGVKLLTLYAFSTENWSRPKTEIAYLMRMLRRFLVEQEEHMLKNNIVFEVTGRIGGLPGGVQDQLERTAAATRGNTGLVLCLALNYGGRAEIADAARKIAEQVHKGMLSPEAVDQELFARHLYTDSRGEPFPDVDLMIRTAGEMRISNFLLWQAWYSEFYVTDVCWPDFRAEQLRMAIEEYGRRARKFGGLKDDKDDGESSNGLGVARSVHGGNAH
ncbi:MAG: isoprenyl transferase [Planctomycetes bacterium]|nr:isoprenyl transferase [Planctomycetota bacterium]